jgi:hypothetical protein
MFLFRSTGSYLHAFCDSFPRAATGWADEFAPKRPRKITTRALTANARCRLLLVAGAFGNTFFHSHPYRLGFGF